MTFALFLTLFNELFPVVIGAVHAVQASAPVSTPGAQKFDAALTAVKDVVNAAPAVSAEFTNAKAELSKGDATALETSAGHMIELALSVSKSFGLLPKAPEQPISQGD